LQAILLEGICRAAAATELKRGLARAVYAFIQELDKMTLADAITAPSVADSLLGVAPPVLLPETRAAKTTTAGRKFRA
jgi:Rrf2 family transcriptional regulator, nitric oxide-sensitive transcriptional repressor